MQTPAAEIGRREYHRRYRQKNAEKLKKTQEKFFQKQFAKLTGDQLKQ